MERVSQDMTAVADVNLDEDGFPIVFQQKRAFSANPSASVVSLLSLGSTVQYEDTHNIEQHPAIDDAGFPIFDEPMTPTVQKIAKVVGLTPDIKRMAAVDTNSRRHKVDRSTLATSIFLCDTSYVRFFGLPSECSLFLGGGFRAFFV